MPPTAAAIGSAARAAQIAAGQLAFELQADDEEDRRSLAAALTRSPVEAASGPQCCLPTTFRR